MTPRPGIHQLLATLAPGDAIGNLVFGLQELIRSWGLNSEIFADCIHPRLTDRCFPSAEFERVDVPHSAAILHYAIHSPAVAGLFSRCASRRVLMYHNITPARYFLDSSVRHYYLTKLARYHLRDVVSVSHLALADSPYNRRELEAHGAADARVVPLLLDLKALDATRAAPEVLARYDDGRTNVIFVGRIAPNKRQDDVIRVFEAYHRDFDPRSRLILVGSYCGLERYHAELVALVRHAGLEDAVVFTDHVDESHLRAYYACASLFLCLSEHEGFGAPLLEAMHFGVPVIAHASAAVPDTMGDAGVLVREKADPRALAGIMHRVTTDARFRKEIIAGQRRRLAHFAPSKVRSMLKVYLGEVLAA